MMQLNDVVSVCARISLLHRGHARSDAVWVRIRSRKKPQQQNLFAIVQN
jgi:hypothetical protein